MLLRHWSNVHRVVSLIVTLILFSTLIHTTDTNDTAQNEPRPTTRPTVQENKPEPRKIGTTRSQERKPIKQKSIKKPQQKKAVGGTSWSAGRWDRFPGWVEQFGLCVAKHESFDWPKYTKGRESIWQAGNVHGGTSSGAFQFIDQSWRSYSKQAGHGGYAKAKYAPAHIQAAVFAHVVMEYGRYPWAGTGCKGT